MTEPMEKRACELAVYMIETGATVRSAARHFGISKSTVHKDLTHRLKQINNALYVQVRQVLDVNNNPIPGLYAAGMASAGWVGPFYPGSGTALLGAIHFGRKAGKVVAAL